MTLHSNMWNELRDELARAQARYGLFHSTHEGYGVLAEEVAELLEAIRSNHAGSIDEEAMQVAAVAIRIVKSCRMKGANGVAFAERSGFSNPEDRLVLDLEADDDRWTARARLRPHSCPHERPEH